MVCSRASLIFTVPNVDLFCAESPHSKRAILTAVVTTSSTRPFAPRIEPQLSSHHATRVAGSSSIATAPRYEQADNLWTRRVELRWKYWGLGSCLELKTIRLNSRKPTTTLSGSVSLVFVVGKLALTGYAPTTWPSPVSITPPMLHSRTHLQQALCDVTHTHTHTHTHKLNVLYRHT